MPALASTSRAALSYIPETVFGTTPGVGTVKNLRFTGESLNFNLSKTSSSEIRSDRQVPGAVTVDANAEGSIEFELQYAEYDPFLNAVLGSAGYTVFGTNGVSAVSTISFAATTLTASVATTGSSDWSTLQRGQWFRVSAPGNANDGKFFRVHSTTAPTSTVITLDPSTPATVAATIAGCTIAASRATHGVTETSFSIERSMADVAQFMTYKGMRVGKLGLKFSTGSLTTGSFEFMGKGVARAGVTAMPSAPAASYAYSIQNGVRGVGQIWEGGAPLTSTYIKSMDLNIDNALRQQDAMGTLGPVGIGTGDFALTGSFSAYFADGTQYDKFINDAATSLVVGSQDSAGNGYIASMPNVQLMSAKVVAGSKASDIMAEFTYQAFPDDANSVAALRRSLFLDRVGAAVT